MQTFTQDEETSREAVPHAGNPPRVLTALEEQKKREKEEKNRYPGRSFSTPLAATTAFVDNIMAAHHVKASVSPP